MTKPLMTHFVPICAAYLHNTAEVASILKPGSTAWLCPKSLVISAGRDKMELQGNTLVHTEPQFHRQNGLGSCLGGRMERIQSLPWKQLVPAWHHLVVRENSLPRNPGATLASPSHHLSRVKAPVQLHTPHSHWHNRFPHQLYPSFL